MSEAASPPVIGVIGNPRSHGSRGLRGEALRRVAAQAGERVLLREPEDRAALRQALSGFARAGVRVVAVSGGDGTLREVLTALPAAWQGKAPDIALLPAGKTDIVAGDVGHSGRGALGLRRLVKALAEGVALRRVERPVLEVNWPGEATRRLRGFLFGAAAFAEGHRLANAKLHGNGFFGNAAVGLTVAAMFGRAVLSGQGTLAHGQEIQVVTDRVARPTGNRFLVLITTLDRLMLGLWPFADNGKGPVRWLDIQARPRQLGRALWAVSHRGSNRSWMPAAGYESGLARQVDIQLHHPFVLDGEVYVPGEKGVTLTAAARQGFVSV
ncbi:diacylglycerol kinase family protein [Roseomonas elaeocarpi]|uniref:Diacylglycerol kinase family protein n=1 Tax=Roseomonas elaeocarpi TaxID=907779 RepID=A0ABV6JQP2_9PROT